MIGLLERQIQTADGMGEVWRGRIIERIRTTLKARIEKERGKCVERKEGYSNDEDALRQEFESFRSWMDQKRLVARGSRVSTWSARTVMGTKGESRGIR